MDAYSGKYRVEGSEEMEATVLLLKDKISIGIHGSDDQPKVLYWYYDHIREEDFWTGASALIRHEGVPVQTLKVGDKNIVADLRAKMHQHRQSFFKKLVSGQGNHAIKILGGLVLFILAFYFWILPFMAFRIVERLPVSYERKLGNEIYGSLIRNFETDTAQTKLLNAFFREMNIKSSYPIHITVVKEKSSNAFALPGGNIIVHDQLLKEMKSHEELAALLSHEFVHVENRHTSKTLVRQMGSSIFITLFFGDIGSVGGLIINNADRIKNLSYSRNLEKEADLEGLKLLSERGINGKGYVSLFELLQKESTNSGNAIAEWISSHPDLDKRIAYIKKNIRHGNEMRQQHAMLKNLFRQIKTKG